MYTVQADVRTWTVYNFSGSRQLLRYTVQYTVKRENKLCVGGSVSSLFKARYWNIQNQENVY